jgi:hypothetical protein
MLRVSSTHTTWGCCVCQPKALVDGILRKAGVEPEEDLWGELETEERQERQEKEAAEEAELDQEAEEDGEVLVRPSIHYLASRRRQYVCDLRKLLETIPRRRCG